MVLAEKSSANLTRRSICKQSWIIIIIVSLDGGFLKSVLDLPQAVNKLYPSPKCKKMVKYNIKRVERAVNKIIRTMISRYSQWVVLFIINAYNLFDGIICMSIWLYYVTYVIIFGFQLDLSIITVQQYQLYHQLTKVWYNTAYLHYVFICIT